MTYWLILLASAGLLTFVGCSLRKILPQRAVLTPRERKALFSQPAPSGARYLDAPKMPFSPLPFQIFALSYDLDLVVVIQHEKWNMHEFARVKAPSGDLWLVKEADHSGLQTIIADTPELFTLAPEVDVPRFRKRVEVSDQSSSDTLDIRISYENRDSEPVELHYTGPKPKKAPWKRNGNTMGHSRQTLLAVLDLTRQAPAKKVSLRINGEPQPIRKILGIKPFLFALAQTQAGLSSARFTQRFVEGGFLLNRDGIEETWTMTEEGERVIATREGFTTLIYEFQKNGDSLELIAAEVRQFGYEEPGLRIEVNPALPDLRRPFSGSYKSRFVIDVNGQEGHAYGDIVVSGTDDGAVIEILPRAPFWVESRPMRTVVRLGDGEALVESARFGPGE